VISIVLKLRGKRLARLGVEDVERVEDELGPYGSLLLIGFQSQGGLPRNLAQLDFGSFSTIYLGFHMENAHRGRSAPQETDS